MDRGTDPMEADHLANAPQTSKVATSDPSTSSTQTITPTLPISMPGPSGLSRQNPRPIKRPNANIHSTKSDSSTVYQSDSSSSSDSGESPTPKRRISIVPNSKMFRKLDAVPKAKDSSTSTIPPEKFDKRKKLFPSRSSAFHLTRSSSSQSLQINPRSEQNSDRHAPNSSHIRYVLSGGVQRQEGSDNLTLPPEPRRAVPTQEYFYMYRDFLRSSRNQSTTANPTERNDSNYSSDLPLSRLRGRLRGISEGSLSSADEVINFSERTSREESTPETPDTNDFSIDTIYRNILTDLETVRNTSRNTDPTRSNSETSNILQGFSQRLENIMNQSDAILANLRRSMDILMEPSQLTGQNNASTSADGRGRGFTLRRGSDFHIHTRQCVHRCTRAVQRSSNSYSLRVRSPGVRYNRPRSNRTSRHINMSVIDQMWRPPGDHNYLREPEGEIDIERHGTAEELLNNLLSSPTSPSREVNEENDPETPAEPARSSTPVPFLGFPSDHTYPLSDSPRDENQTERIDPNTNPIADHTYPRDPQSSEPSNPDYLTPLVTSLHSTTSRISMQTNLLRRQVETIEIIDRARYEVFQLQEMRLMWEDIRRHIIFFNTPLNDRRMNNSNMSNVRQMMAWTRISDPSPSSESAQSSTEQSTPEPSTSTDIPTPSTSRSSASSSNESRSNTNQNPQPLMLGRFRQNHLKKRAQNRLYWRRRTMRNETPNFAPRRFNRSFNQYRDMTARQNRNPDSRESNLAEINVSVMIRGLENLLLQNLRLLGRATLSPSRNNIERRLLSEIDIQDRLRNARQRLNQLNGYESRESNVLEGPNEYTTSNRNDSIRYEARLRLSIFIESFTGFIENRNSPIPQILGDQMKILTGLSVLLTDLLLLQIMETIPSSSGSFLDPERASLARRIHQLCSVMMQNPSRSVSSSLTRILLSIRLTVRNIIPAVRLSTEGYERRTQYLNRREMLDLNQQLRGLYQFCSNLEEPERSSTNEPAPSTSQNNNNVSNQSLSHVYRLGDLLASLRNIRGRLEQMSQQSLGRLEQLSQDANQTANNSSTEHDPARSTDDSPSDRESESFEGFQSDITSVYRDRFAEPGTLYRTSHVNLYPPEQNSFQNSPERLPNPVSPRNERPWNIPTVQVNDVTVSNSEMAGQPQPLHPRLWSSRYALSDHPVAALRPLSAATGLFRPRFLIPLYAGVNPFDTDLDEGQRETSGTYDGVMTATVSPNHRIQMWDISKCHIPNISNRKFISLHII